MAAGAVLLLAIVRPSILRGAGRWLDGALLLCLLAVGVQLIPLPAATRDRLSPQAYTVERAVALDSAPADRLPRPLSVEPESTAWALALAATYIGLFWCARAIFAGGGVRTIVRGMAWLGLILTVLVTVQRATSPNLLYWTYRPLSPGASPYGPFVNRNSLATWLVMALPLVIGYAMARNQSRQRPKTEAIPGASIDAMQLWLLGAAALMSGCLLASMSRAGIIGGAIGLVTFVVFARKRITRRGAAILAAGLAGATAMSLTSPTVGRLMMRAQETTELGDWGRPAIWRDAWRMASDFWITGVGAGAFARGMLVYQQGSRLFFFNHAHDEYLQIVTEGGLLVAIPVTAAIVAAIALMARDLRRDRSAIFWLRAGAVSGIVAVAVQSIWDTGLRTPANGVLFAVVAAAAVYEVPASRTPRTDPDNGVSRR